MAWSLFYFIYRNNERGTETDIFHLLRLDCLKWDKEGKFVAILWVFCGFVVVLPWVSPLNLWLLIVICNPKVVMIIYAVSFLK